MRFRFNWMKTFSRIAANAIVNPTKTTYKPSSTSTYLTNKAIKNIRYHHFRLWK